MIEVREKSLPSISLLCFDTDDSLTVRHKSESDTILRNDYYRVAVSLAGLTGQDVNATITVADWKPRPHRRSVSAHSTVSRFILSIPHYFIWPGAR